MDESQEKLMMTFPPLVRFSVYSQAQVECLQRLSCELTKLLDEDGGLGANFQKIYGNFWLWVLGTYEVSRTMCEYKNCFSDRLYEDVLLFKKRIAVIRMPFAKQQHKGNGKCPINAEASVASFNSATKDMAYSVDGTLIWVRPLLAEFDSLVQSIGHADVFHDLRDAPISGQ